MNDFIYASISSCLSTIIVHPLDTLKVWKQTNAKYNVRMLYKGCAYPIVNSVFINGILFSNFYDNKYITSIDNKFISGGVNGFLTSFIINPLDIYKIRLQNNMSIKNINPIRGLNLTIARETIGCSIYFGSYEFLKKKEVPIIISGGFAGLSSWIVTYPIDSIKTRVQSGNFNIASAINKGNLWNGILYCSIRAVISNSILLYSYEYLKNIH